ncbi:MAG: hypothetical protein WCK46_02560 [Candidatus Adlerbacteria bacterium]
MQKFADYKGSWGAILLVLAVVLAYSLWGASILSGYKANTVSEHVAQSLAVK